MFFHFFTNFRNCHLHFSSIIFQVCLSILVFRFFHFFELQCFPIFLIDSFASMRFFFPPTLFVNSLLNLFSTHVSTFLAEGFDVERKEAQRVAILRTRNCHSLCARNPTHVPSDSGVNPCQSRELPEHACHCSLAHKFSFPDSHEGRIPKRGLCSLRENAAEPLRATSWPPLLDTGLRTNTCTSALVGHTPLRVSSSCFLSSSFLSTSSCYSLSRTSDHPSNASALAQGRAEKSTRAPCHQTW